MNENILIIIFDLKMTDTSVDPDHEDDFNAGLMQEVEYQGPHGSHHQPGLQCRQGRTQGRRRCRWSEIQEQAPSLGQSDPRLL